MWVKRVNGSTLELLGQLGTLPPLGIVAFFLYKLDQKMVTMITRIETILGIALKQTGDTDRE